MSSISTGAHHTEPPLALTADRWAVGDPYPIAAPGGAALGALIRAICPPPPAPQFPDLEARVAMQARTLMRYMPRPVAWGLRAAFRLLDHSPRLLLMSHRRLRGLAPEQARAVIARLAASPFAPVRELVYAVRGIILSVYFDQDEVHRALGYDPRAFVSERVAVRGRLLAGGPRAEDMIPSTPGLDPVPPQRFEPEPTHR
ncbi:MAG: hypothetical protein H6697_02320 [Myxococcales bacterium]|nr:hypothetical protein [Myxococcales bacterium]